MKSILLASASVFAFAGAAAAEISFTGSAALGYNDDDLATVADDEYGFYWDADVAVTMSAELDNGLTASATFNFEAADNDNGQNLTATDYVLSLSNDVAGLYFGDTSPAADKHWASAGDMEADGFSENDGETILRGDVTFGGVNASVSYNIGDDGARPDATLEQLSVGVDGSFGNVTFALAFQEASTWAGGSGDFNGDEILGISAGTTFGAADITVAYADNATSGLTSTGVKVAYPFGPVVVTAYYVMEDNTAGTADDNFGLNVAYTSGPVSVTLDYQDDQGTQKIALDGTYDVGNGLNVLAGFYTEDSTGSEDEFYVAATYDLGGGASVLVAFADGDDEVGSPEYENGTTVEVSFEF